MQRLQAILCIMFMSAMSILADSFLKSAGQPQTVDKRLFFQGTVLYALSSVGWFFIFRSLRLTEVAVLYPTVTMVGLVMVGVVYFGESIVTQDIIGLLLAVCGIVLMSKHI